MYTKALNTLPYKNKLKGHKLIESLFEERRSIKVYPFVIIYKIITKRDCPMLFGVSASKRNFKRAVDRNKIKRIVREAYRRQQSDLLAHIDSKNYTIAAMFLYIGKDIPSFDLVDAAMKKSLIRIQSLKEK